MLYQVLLGCSEWVEVLRWGWEEVHLFPDRGLLSSHDTLLSNLGNLYSSLTLHRARCGSHIARESRNFVENGVYEGYWPGVGSLLGSMSALPCCRQSEI